MRKCSKCDRSLGYGSFHRDVSQSSGYASQCKECRQGKDTRRRDRIRELNRGDVGVLRGEDFDTSEPESIVAGGVDVRKVDVPAPPAPVVEAPTANAPWPHGADMKDAAPLGFHVKGVSTLYDEAGEVKAQWVKSTKTEADRMAAFELALKVSLEPYRGLADPVATPADVDDDLMCAVVLGDPHLGLYAWAQETGDRDFDLDIAERNIVTAVDRLMSVAPYAERGLLASLGDTFHADGYDNRTAASGHALDVDTRWPKVMTVGIRTMRRSIDRMLDRFGIVDVKIIPGNHDPHSSMMLSLCLAQFYEREPRVKVDVSPGAFRWLRFGTNLLGFTHGHMTKMQDLPGIMAADCAKDWGETEHRVVYQGHVHHDQVKEYRGCTVISRRTLAARDAWHSASGYRSGQDLKMDVYHRRWGLVNQHIVGIQRVIADEAA